MTEQIDIKKFISYLKSIGKVANQEEFGKKLGYENKASFSRKINSEIKEDFIEKIKSVFPEYDEWKSSNVANLVDWYNARQVHTDKKSQAFEDLHRVTKKIKNKSTSEGRIIDESQLIPVHQYIIPLKGQAGLRKAFFYPDEYINTNFEREVIYVKPEERAVYYKIEVDGNSMVGKLDPGDWTRCEDIPKMYWIEKGTFKPEKIYCLIHRTRGILFKRISKMHNENITLTSDNPDKAEYPDETFDLNEFSKILIVRKIEKDA